jgi:hypothetical protein
MLALTGLYLTMMESGSLVGTGMAITAGASTTITRITTTTAIIVITTITSLKLAPGLDANTALHPAKYTGTSRRRRAY